MTAAPRRSPSRAARALIWVLLAVCALGPQHSLRVCTNGTCGVFAFAPVAEACCSRCAARESPPDDGSPRHWPHADHDCCLDVAAMDDVPPLPRADTAAVAPLDVMAIAAAFVAPLWPPRAGSWPHATGPPRIDGRLLRIATTNLRL